MPQRLSDRSEVECDRSPDHYQHCNPTSGSRRRNSDKKSTRLESFTEKGNNKKTTIPSFFPRSGRRPRFRAINELWIDSKDEELSKSMYTVPSGMVQQLKEGRRRSTGASPNEFLLYMNKLRRIDQYLIVNFWIYAKLLHLETLWADGSVLTITGSYQEQTEKTITHILNTNQTLRFLQEISMQPTTD